MYTYDELKQFVDHCTRCPLSQTRNKAVMGKGNLHSPILFIAEGPGRNEDQDGIPFTGKSGVLLDRLLSENRDPKPEEQELCIPYLKYETLLLRPKIIVCLGRIAAQRIIRPDYRITREHGTFLYRKNVWLTAVYHPSVVLRDDTKLPEVTADFRMIKEKLDDITRRG